MPYKITERFLCAICRASTPPVDNEVGEDEADTRLPPQWLGVTLRRVVPNPAYAEEQQRKSAAIEQTVAMAAAGGATVEEQAQAREAMQAAQGEPEEEPYTVEETYDVLCPDHVGKLVETLEITLGAGEVP